MELFVGETSVLCAVGRTSRHSCASIRAGLSRPVGLSEVELVDPDTLDPLPLIGHPIAGFSEGFHLLGLWKRLGAAVLSDLTEQAESAGRRQFWADSAILLSLPRLVGDRFQQDQQPSIDLRESLIEPICSAQNIKLSSDRFDIICNDHVSAIQAVAKGREMLEASVARRVIVLAIDSYLDSLTLEWLATEERLKSPSNPVGLSPGEAAAAFVLESSPENLGGIRIESEHLEASDWFLGNGEPNRGDSLVKSVRKVLRRSNGSMPFTGHLISDQNGEYWRAVEFGHAIHQLAGDVDANCPRLFPATSTGEIGAASSAVSICLASHLLSRECAHSGQVLIFSSTQEGMAASVIVTSQS